MVFDWRWTLPHRKKVNEEPVFWMRDWFFS